MSVKFIAITQRLIENASYYEVREALSVEWGEFFKKNLSGFLPLPLSYALDFKEYKSCVSGVILSGGNDLDILNPNSLSKMRDIYEREIIKLCVEKEIPLFGICRGAQMIASYFESQLSGCKGHVGEHFVDINKVEVLVNSFHNFCIDSLGSDLEALGFAKDGSIEAFKHKKLPIFANMWHVEREKGMQEKSVFLDFLRAIKEK